ncbi:uncharacterized protein LOC116259323 [Nymphaea colorata]|uniref:uncharacterized protein LOC116259323 n=1 Tax=Nymphaea colorata TaxID=210225 RepID=UPI00129EC67A|nr:uncharacterized protein LOC116259323 [Nymphaea colorata]
MQFLMGLNDSYAAIRSQLLLMDLLPTIAKAYSLLIQEEKQRDVNMVHAQEKVSILATQPPPQVHERNKNNHTKERGRPRMKCKHCGKIGHIKAKCYFLVGFPNRSGSSNALTKPKANAALRTTSTDQPNEQPFTKFLDFMENSNQGTNEPRVNLLGPSLDDYDWNG